MPTVVKKALRTAAAWSANQAAMEALYGVDGYYSLASTWAAALPASLVTSDEQHILECYDDWPSGLSDSFTVTSTTDATRFVKITAAAGAEYDHVTGSGFHLKKFLNYGGVVGNLGSYGVLEKIGVYNTGGVSSNAIASVSDNTVISNITASSSAYAVNTNNANATLNNCLAVISGSASVGFYSGNWGTTAWDNCTTIDTSGLGKGFEQGTTGASGTATNCLSIGAATGFVAGVLGNYNASSDASAPGANSLHSRTTADLVNYAGGDYRTASGSALATAGSGGTYIGAVLEVSGVVITGSGAHQAQAVTHSGAGVRIVVGTSTHQAQLAASVGSGARVVGAYGSHQAQTATHTGVGTISAGVTIISGAGSHQASVATHTGAGKRIIIGVGTHTAQPAQHSNSYGGIATLVTEPVILVGKLSANVVLYKQLDSGNLILRGKL